MSLRDTVYQTSFDAFAATTRLDERIKLPEPQRMRVGIIQLSFKSIETFPSFLHPPDFLLPNSVLVPQLGG